MNPTTTNNYTPKAHQLHQLSGSHPDIRRALRGQKAIGVYRIHIGKRYYIGHSIDLSRRLREHARALEDGRHHSATVQEAYESEGRPELRVLVDLYETQAAAYIAEQRLINDRFGWRSCLNDAKTVPVPVLPEVRSSGAKASPKVRALVPRLIEILGSEETRAKGAAWNASPEAAQFRQRVAEKKKGGNQSVPLAAAAAAVAWVVVMASVQI